MANKSGGDLLKALLERQRREKQSIEADSTTPPIALSPVAVKPESEPKSVFPVTLSPTPVPNPPAKLEIVREGVHFTIRELLIGLVVIVGLVAGAFFLGAQSAKTGGQANPEQERVQNIPDPPSAGLFSWSKAFTIQAIAFANTKADEQKLSDMKNYLESYKITASPVQFPDAGKIALFVGGADRADDKSLVKLRDWLRELPGPDRSGKPFKSASIRETPRNK